MNTESKITDDLIIALKKGLVGGNKGLPTGIPKLNKAINGLSKGVIIGVAGASKSGKSTIVDSSFLISPYIEMIEKGNIDIEWFYWSLEMSKLDIRFKTIAHFFYRDYQISTITLPEGDTYKGSPVIPISASYLLGRLETDNDVPIKVSEEHQVIFKEIVEKRINPMFGKYDNKGKKISKGKVTLIEDTINPTGMFHYLMDYAKQNGKFIYEEYYVINNLTSDREKKKRISGYEPNNPDKYVIVIIDHLRALKREKNYTMKQNVDKILEYFVFLRNLCKFSIIPIIHLNRNISDIQRIKFNNEYLYPTDSDVKETGNMAEVVDFLLTVFDAGDEQYNIKKHFGMDITDIIDYRSLHLVKSRHTAAPAHIQLKAYFGISTFEEL